MSATAPSRAAGTHRIEDAVDGYFENPRPELVALVPAHARVVVDVGCGYGALGETIRRERGAWVLGLEFVPEAAAVARERLDRVEQVDLDALETLSVDPGTVDAFVCGDVLEHLRDPERLLKVLHDHLAPGGVVIASIPNVKHWSVVAPLILDDRFTYQQNGLLDRTHVHLFTLDELSLMLGRVGLTPTHADVVRIPMPPELRPLGEMVAQWGRDVPETIARLEAYQYFVVATRPS